MTSTEHKHVDPVASRLQWGSLVRRSFTAWKTLKQDAESNVLVKSTLEECAGLEEFLSKSPTTPMFWFFQRREAFLTQSEMQKWSQNSLDDYVLLPATPGFVTRVECFFVSHFWESKDHPDPDGKYLRLLQGDLRQQTWSFIWTDWTCLPQHPRNQQEDTYFLRGLQTMSGIIRNCGFAWFYPPFEARMWILYEIAESTLTSIGELEPTEDMQDFRQHINEMVHIGVRPTLKKHGYHCTYPRDMDFLTSWLELLVLLTKLHIHIADVRKLLDQITWFPSTEVMIMYTAKGVVNLQRFEGVLTLDEQEFVFTAFPRWEDGKYSAKITANASKAEEPAQ